MADYWQEAPPVLQEFLNYHESILSHSSKTVDEYFLDLRAFFRYLKLRRDPSLFRFWMLTWILSPAYSFQRFTAF